MIKNIGGLLNDDGQQNNIKRCCVTGAAGFIGYHLTRRLLNDGYTVTAVDNLSTGSSERIESLAQLGNLTFLPKDINELTIEELEGHAGIFHLAALPRVQVSIDRPEETNHANVTGTLHLYETAKRANIKKIIYSASSSAYGDQEKFPLEEDMKPNPMNPYAIQKLVGEYYGQVYTELFGMQVVSLRYFNVYGPGQSDDSPYTGVITLFKKAVREGKPIEIHGDGKQSRDFTYVDDVVEANLAAFDSWATGVYNIGAGQAYSINQIADIIGGEKYEKVFVNARQGDPEKTLADIQKARMDLAWEPKTELKDKLNSF